MSESTKRRHDGSRRLSELTATERHDVLSSERRRIALEVIETRRSPLELDELAALVATEEHDLDDPTEKAVEQTGVSLHHVHLPKLARAGVVQYDADAKRITPTHDNSPS